MAAKQNPQKDKKSPAAKAGKKERSDKSTPINPHARDILDAAVSKLGCTKTDFASKAIIAYAREKLGDDMPASPEEELEERLNYLERNVSQRLWRALCKENPVKAQRMYDIAEELEFDSQNMLKECIDLYQKRHKGEKVGNKNLWKTVALAVKFKFSPPR